MRVSNHRPPLAGPLILRDGASRLLGMRRMNYLRFFPRRFTPAICSSTAQTAAVSCMA